MDFRSLIAVAILVCSVCAAAQADVRRSDEERAFNREQFADWGGIVFRCVLSNEANKLENALCDRASEDARFLAATAKIPFKSVGTDGYFQVVIAQRELNHALVLTVHIHSLLEPVSAHILLEASSFYSAAVDLSKADGTPESKPRGGTLSLWTASVIGAGGTSSELEQGLAHGLETRLKAFMSIYAESR